MEAFRKYIKLLAEPKPRLSDVRKLLRKASLVELKLIIDFELQDSFRTGSAEYESAEYERWKFLCEVARQNYRRLRQRIAEAKQPELLQVRPRSSKELLGTPEPPKSVDTSKSVRPAYGHLTNVIAKCRDCGNTKKVPSSIFLKAASAKCLKCGGLLDCISDSC